MTVPPRVNLLTLGVSDVGKARAFYERLGWRASSFSNASVAFFHTGGAIVALWGAKALSDDARVPATPPGALALAINVRERGDVDAALASAAEAGARITRVAEDTFWGGRNGYFADPEGHLWEIAWNPGFPLGGDDLVQLPD